MIQDSAQNRSRSLTHQDSAKNPREPKDTSRTASKVSVWDCITGIIAVLGLIMAVIAFCEGRHNASVARRIKVGNLLNQAWDFLGGKEGKPRLGTKMIVHDTARYQTQLELASREFQRR